MEPTIPPEVAEHLVAAAGAYKQACRHLPPEEAERRFVEMAKLYYPETTTNLRAV